MPVENDRDGAENSQPAPGGFVWGLKPQDPAVEVAAAEVPAGEVPANGAALNGAALNGAVLNGALADVDTDAFAALSVAAVTNAVPGGVVPAVVTPAATPAAGPAAGEPVPLIVPTPAFWVPVALTPAAPTPAAPAPLDTESSVPAPPPPPLVPPPLAVPRTDESELRNALFTPPAPLVPPQTGQTWQAAQTEKTEALGLDSLFGTLHGAGEPGAAPMGAAPTIVSPAVARNTFTPAASAAVFADPASATPTAAALVRERTGRDTTGGSSGTPVSRILIWVAAGLLGVVLLLGLFFLGQQLAGSPAPVAEPSASATPTPTPTVTGTLPAGVHAWDTLNGGECLEPYVSPWEEEFTVVDCTEAHTAQLVYVAPFAEADGDFPGEEALASQVNLLCSIPGVIDLTAAGEFPDVQVQGSYPVTAEQWDDGDREYSCFVSRASAEPLTATLAGPGPTPAG